MFGNVFPGFAIAYVVAALLSFITAAVVWRRHGNPGNIAFSLIMISLCIWSFASVFEAGTPLLEEKIFWSKCQYIGIAALPVFWLQFAAEYTRQRPISRQIHQLILVIPTITLLMAFTNERHYLLWSEITLLPGPIHIAKYAHGPWFFVHITYTYSLLLIGTIWLVKAFSKFPFSKRHQVYIIFLGLIIGWTANILYITGLFPIEGLDITPLSFTLIAFIISWNIFQFRLFDIVPIARNMVLDNMADGVIVLDPNDVIIDINPSAQAMFARSGERKLLGLTLWEALGDYADLLVAYKEKPDFSTEVKISDDPPRFIGFNVSTIRDNQKQNAGRVVVIFDITQRKLAENKEADQRKLAEALASTAAVINSSLDLNDVLDKILENVDKVVPSETANIALVDINHIARFVKVKGYEKYGTEKIVPTIECRVDEIPNLKRMAETGKALLNPNTEIDPDWDRSIRGSQWIKSYMGAPIIAKGNLLGFISLDAPMPDYFKEEYLPRLEAFANQAAVAIQNAQYFREISESAREMQILYEVGLAVTSGLGLDNTISTLFKQLKSVVPVDLFYLAMLDEKQEYASFIMFQHDGIRLNFDQLSMKEHPSLTRYVIEKGQTVYIPDSKAKDTEFPEKDMVKMSGHDERSILGIPLLLRDRILGALFLQADQPEAYTQDQIRLVETIANQASVAIENSQLFEKVQQMAITDNLTGVFNRHYFFAFGENEIARAQRYGCDLSMIMFDIDHFKLVNDRFGHPVGDQALVMVTKACSAVLRKVDVLCRFGGEEFVVLLPETALNEALIAAERIKDAIAEKRLRTEKGEVKVTVSVGVAELTNKKATLRDMIEQSDKALYQAKNAGRNCVRAYKP